MDEVKLLPCPFCGGQAEMFDRLDEMGEGSGEYDIRCKTEDCYLESGADWYCDRFEIVELWNTRTYPQEQDAVGREEGI